MATTSTDSMHEQRNGLKRRQSHTPEPETHEGNDSKRQRTSPGKSSPDIAPQDDGMEGKKEAVPSAIEGRRTSSARDARRQSGVGDEKSKAKRLFGGLLGSLAQPGDRTTKRRQEIESRRKAELQQQDDARVEDKQRQAERLADKRKLVRKRVDKQNVSVVSLQTGMRDGRLMSECRCDCDTRRSYTKRTSCRRVLGQSW